MQALSPVRSPSPVVALAERPIGAGERVYRDTPLVIVAIDIQDPGNVGAIVRVAEAGGATRRGLRRRLCRPVRLEGAARVDGQRAAAADSRGGRSEKP